MREWTDCKREGTGWAGHGAGTSILPPSMRHAPSLCSIAPLASLEPRCSLWAQRGHPTANPSPTLCIHLLGGGDEVHGLQAGQRLPALVDVFHNWRGENKDHGRDGRGQELLDIPPALPDPSSLRSQESQPLGLCGSTGKVTGEQWVCLCAPILLLLWVIHTSLHWRGRPGVGDALVVPRLGQNPCPKPPSAWPRVFCCFLSAAGSYLEG